MHKHSKFFIGAIAVAFLASPLAAATPTAGTSATAKARPGMSAKDVGHLDAVRIGVAKIETVPALNKNLYPNVFEFQDPRVVVKVPSPDGKKLLWRGKHKKGYFLFISDADGGNEERLTACKNGYQPAWSPDGRKILFSAMDWTIEARNLFLYDIATGTSLRAFNARKKVGPLATFSPDGHKILFSYYDDLWLMNSNGIGRSLLNVSGKIEKPIGDAKFVAWSADGSGFCFQMRGEPAIYAVTLGPKI